jgi:plastocyanin
MRSLLSALSAFALVVAVPALAGTIRGTVRVPALASRGPAPDPYPGRAASMPGMHADPRGLVTDAVLSLASVPADVESTLAQVGEPRPHLAQKDQSFVPRVLAIAAGASVDFPNQDPIYHNVFSVSPTRRFDLGKYPRGQSRTVAFPHPGLVNVYCDIHSDMAAFIQVLPNHAFVRPDADGRYALPALPPGRYLLRWWHPDFDGGSREVTVPEQGDAVVDVEF